MVHRQETVDCLRKFNARRKLKVCRYFITSIAFSLFRDLPLSLSIPLPSLYLSPHSTSPLPLPFPSLYLSPHSTSPLPLPVTLPFSIHISTCHSPFLYPSTIHAHLYRAPYSPLCWLLETSQVCIPYSA